MDIIYQITSFLLVIVIIIIAVGLIKPTLLRRFFKSYATRKHVFIGGLISLFVFGGIAGATEPASIKQARLHKQSTQEQAQLISRQQESAKQAAIRTTPEVKTVEEHIAVAYVKEQKNDATQASGTKRISQAGKDGAKRISYEVTYIDGKETSRVKKNETVVTEPVNEVTSIGTYVAPTPKATSPAPQTRSTAPQTTSSGRTGATCRDGTHSNATGRGACSHHGGVATWLYN